MDIVALRNHLEAMNPIHDSVGPPGFDLGTAKAVLSALDGIAYLVDPAGVILAVGEKPWADFATTNGAPGLGSRNVVGRSMLSFIAGRELREIYRRFVESVASGSREVIGFRYRCDSPNRRRDVKLNIAPVRLGGEFVAVLMHNQILDERERPPIDLFDTASVLAAVKRDANLPLVVVCSVCNRVAMGEEVQRAWIEPETYYAMGGLADVRVSHGLCPWCHDALEGELVA